MQARNTGKNGSNYHVIMFFMCVSLLLQVVWGGAPALAASGVEIQIQAGYEGKIKEGHWFPVTFSLTSPYEDLSGDLVLQVTNPMGGKDVSYVKRLDLPKQTTKVVSMTLPGFSMNSSNNVIKFYKGGVDKGTPVPILKGNDYIEADVNHSMMVGVWSRDPDTFNFLSLLHTKNYNVTIVPLDDKKLPEETMMLDGLDVIALNDVSTDQLKPEQVQAVTSWVERGGTLALSGGAGYAKTSKAFEKLSPVTYKGTTELRTLVSLAKITGKELPLSGPFTMSNAELKSGETILQEGSVPLFVRSTLGKGHILYTAYDVSLEPVASWQGNASLWETILQKHLTVSSPNQGKVSMPQQFMNEVWELQSILDFFPSLRMPSFTLLVSLFLVYVVLVAPIMYLILKRMDKREWAWVVIPVVSVVASIGIFAVGATDKKAVISHTLNTIELTGNGQGIGDL